MKPDVIYCLYVSYTAHISHAVKYAYKYCSDAIL